MKQKFTTYLLMATIVVLASCAKENPPVDVMGTNSYGKLYMIQSEGVTVRNGIRFPNTSTINDTVIKSFSVAMGGGNVVAKEVPLSFKVLPNAYLDAFNSTQIPQLQVKPFPDGAVSIATSGVIPAGSTQSALQPVSIKTSMLANATNYGIAVEFTSPDTTYQVDKSRNYAVLTFRTMPSYRGKLIGNIPQGTDPYLFSYAARPSVSYRIARIFDFFGDIIVKDRAGNLIIYPLESNTDPDKLGAPDTLWKAQDGTTAGSPFQYACAATFFNDYNNSIYAEGNAAPLLNSLKRFTVTPRVKGVQGSATINKTPITVAGTSYWYYYGYFFWMGYNGTIHFTTPGGSGVAGAITTTGSIKASLTDFTSSGTAQVQMSRGINETLYLFWTCADGAHIAQNPEGLRIWGALPTTTSLNAMTITSGKNFFDNYSMFTSIKKTDFIGIRKNGDVVRWKNFDKFGWYDGNDYDR